MKYRVNIVINKKPRITADFHFDTLWKFKDFMVDWLKYAENKHIELYLEGYDC